MGVQFGWGQTVGQEAPDVVPVGVFSEMDSSRALPEGWRAISLAAAYDKTEYELVRIDGRVAVRAHSRGRSASSLGTERRIDLGTHPILEWQWKVKSLVEGGYARVPRQHDLPARLIVTFDYDELSLSRRLKLVVLRALGYDVTPRRTIGYFWANRMERHTIVPNPYLPWLKEVAVRSGSTHVGTWVTERRNVRADYQRIFGEEPPSVKTIVIMTDTEKLKGEVTAYYGDIVFRAAPPHSTTVDTTLHGANDEPENR